MPRKEPPNALGLVVDDALADTLDDAPDDSGAPVVGGEVLDDEARLQAKLAKLPPDTRTVLYRVDDVYKRWVIHGVLAPHEVSQVYVAQRFGGGTYQLQVKGASPTGTGEVVRARAKWIIPGAYKGAGDSLPGISAAPHAATPIEPTEPTAKPGTREWLDGILASRAMDVLSGGGQKSDTLAGIAAIVAALGTVTAPLIERALTREPDTRLRDELADLKAELRALRNTPAPGSVKDSLSGLRELVELKDLLGGGDSGAKPSVTDRIIGALPDILQAFQAGRQPAPAPERPALPAPAPETPPATPGAPIVSEGPPWEQLLKDFRAQLLQLAATGWEPDYCADFVLRTMPAEYQGYLAEFVKRDDATALTFQTIPEMKAFETWHPAFLAELKLQMTGEDVADAGDDE